MAMDDHNTPHGANRLDVPPYTFAEDTIHLVPVQSRHPNAGKYQTWHRKTTRDIDSPIARRWWVRISESVTYCSYLHFFDGCALILKSIIDNESEGFMKSPFPGMDPYLEHPEN